MTILKSGNILAATTEAIVNTVNCVGIMGKGLALQFKMKFPENYQFYKKNCDQGIMKIGHVTVFQQSETQNPKYIINFPTKGHWKEKSSVADIKKGLTSLILEMEKLNIKSIAIPALGCGLGGLNWEEIKPIIIEAFFLLPEVSLHLYQPI